MITPFLIIFSAYMLLAVFILRWMELATKNRPKFGRKPTGATLEGVAEEYRKDGKNWPRDWMQSHANQRTAIIKVCALLVDRAEAENAQECRGCGETLTRGEIEYGECVLCETKIRHGGDDGSGACLPNIQNHPPSEGVLGE